MSFVTPDKTSATINYFDVGYDLLPGGVATLHANSLPSSESGRILEITAVLFGDGSADGSPAEIDFLKGLKLGKALETERVRRLLAAWPVERGLGDADVESLTVKVGRVPTSPREAVTSLEGVSLADASVAQVRGAKGVGRDRMNAFFAGVCTARNSALRQLNELRLRPTENGSASENLPGITSRSAFLSNLQQKVRCSHRQPAYAATGYEIKHGETRNCSVPASELFVTFLPKV